jgi:hypothetical protein
MGGFESTRPEEGLERMTLPVYLLRRYGEHAVDAYFVTKAIGRPTEIAIMWALHFGRNYEPGTGVIEPLFGAE